MKPRINYSAIIYMVVCIPLLLSSCKGKMYIASSYDRMMDSKVILPRDMVCIQHGQRIQYGDRKVDRTLLVYVDSSGCRTCRINDLVHYKPYVDDPYYSDLFYTLFIVCPPRSESQKILDFVELIESPMPICVDTCGSFLRQNPFIPEDTRYHTFLMDSENRPIIIGDPLNNSHVGELLDQWVADNNTTN